MQHKFLIHNQNDNVGVAVADITAGESARGVILEDGSSIEVEAKDNIPLGHKVALRPVDAGAWIIKYGVEIGVTTRQINKGEHVHIHNLKSARW